MNRFIALEFLKLYLGTLFFSNYNLPSEDEVKKVISDAAAVQPLDLPFHTPFDLLRDLISELLIRKNDLLHLAKTNGFLGSFADRRIDNGAIVFPFSKSKSTLIFFEKFLNEEFVPSSHSDFLELIEWALYAVQFKEANEQRTLAALDLLTKVRSHLIAVIPMTEVRFDKGDKVNKVKINFESKDNINFDAYPDTNTKHCDCYVYEVSGDCYCLDDM